MPDDVEIAEIQPLDPSSDLCRVPVERVRSVGTTGEAMSGKIEHQHPTPGEAAPDVPPRAMGVIQSVQEKDRRAMARFGPMERDLAEVDLAVLRSDGRPQSAHRPPAQVCSVSSVADPAHCS